MLDNLNPTNQRKQNLINQHLKSHKKIEIEFL